MNNHVHLLIEQNDEYPLSKYMQRLQSAYTNFFNRKHGKVGHLFQGRYKSILVDKDSYLVELVRYIHLNPHRAGLENADKYPWTSHRQYLGKDRYPLAPVNTEKVLGVFSKMKPIARRKYLAYVMEKRKDGKKNGFYDLRDGRILGDEEFEEEVHEMAGFKKQELTLKLDLELGNLWKAICKRDGCVKEPKGWTRSRLMAETAYLAMEGMNVKQNKVAEYFGVEPSGVNMALKRLGARWEKGEGSKEALVAWSKGIKDCEF